MHLSEILQIRSSPGQCCFLSITRKCPLHCAHCATESSMEAMEELEEEDILRFVDTFSEDPPQILFLTGGEALTRPSLVHKIALKAKDWGVKVHVTSGMFFAKEPLLSPSLSKIIEGLSHFTASVDSFHEAQVSREKVFRSLKTILDMGISVSIQTLARENHDPYVKDLVRDTERCFGSNVPIFLAPLVSSGRASSWVSCQIKKLETPGEIHPCSLASWPVVNFQGNIVACCHDSITKNQQTPSHLCLGNIRNTTWKEVKHQMIHSTYLRALRTYGPLYLASQCRNEIQDYCEACMYFLPDQKKLENLMRQEKAQFIEEYAQKIAQKKSYLLPEYGSVVYSLFKI